MFDNAKVQQMTDVLARFAQEHENIYVIPEWLTPEPFALFRRLRITVRAILIDAPQKEIFGCPTLNLTDAIKNFSDKTGIIFLSKKSQPQPLNMLTFPAGNQNLNVPAFIANADEISAIYDRLTVMKILQQYREDGLVVLPFKNVAQRFARGVTTFLNPDTENIKIQFWDRNSFVAPRYDVDDTAIVLRGQIVYENRYTEKTCEFYRSIYANAPIIVSAWKNEITEEFRRACEKNSVVLLENTPPAIPGFGHLNYQLENAFRGVDYVQKNTSAKFIMVSRTDQRFNKPTFLLSFRNLIQEFPAFGEKLHGRIIILGDGLTKKYLPFAITDFFAFGYVSDVAKFYDLPRQQDLSEHKYYLQHWNRFYSLREKLARATFERLNFVKHRRRIKKFNAMINKFVDADMFWMKNFYRKHIAPLDETKLLETWWKFIRDYLLFVDGNALAFDWLKHEHHRYNATYDGINGTDFLQWLDLYRNFNPRLGLV